MDEFSDYGSAVTADVSSSSMNERHEELFMRLLVKHERHVHGFILSLVANWQDAEEILQNTFVRLCQQIDKWDPDKDFRAWACAVARYEVLTYRRKAQRSCMQLSQQFVERVVQEQDLQSGSLGPRAEALNRCIEKLAPTRRRLLDLAYRGGFSVEQVAEQLDYSIAATYKALARLRKALHECIERTVRAQE